MIFMISIFLILILNCIFRDRPATKEEIAVLRKVGGFYKSYIKSLNKFQNCKKRDEIKQRLLKLKDEDNEFSKKYKQQIRKVTLI